ncbi:DegT/DnrJ/EryC1/StrS family aminotransferase [Paenibacillus rhizovicinus]|uniref:DegT/DnrJ/EryC1/StrS family aminotransferase n=1 Tax=Paenibacillus rhizovicinus TaxID=2704463 RepID=A0A6C0NX88_9BACL|nr:DegT/DnrJ/EryC1/StrS family aminotransferase [Paenibacillus rhizovicinus]QHW30827.1 DegT/DnrJ/EryC1/StrS family aminotransferase [Paenibacillus rhizovicinus]
MLAKHGGVPIRTKPWVPTFISSEEFDDMEKSYVMRVLEKKRVFRFYGEGLQDSEAAKLEQLYRERTQTDHALAVNAGTSALVSALVGAGIGPGDEVIVPAYTYIATAAAVLIARAVPVIVEIDETLTMDPAAFEAAITPYTKAVIPVHMRGTPCQMDEIMAIARRRKLAVIEDVAQANGGSYKGRPLGGIGDAGCFSFQQYKVVTSGEGGMVVTNDAELQARASVYHDCAVTFWGVEPTARIPSFAGENYRMSEIQAALGLAQSEKIDSVVARLRKAKQMIVEGIADVEGIQLQRVPDPDGDVSYSLVFFLPDGQRALAFSELLSAEGIPNGTIHNNGFADRHIYVNWDYVLDKRGATPNDTPWNCASYKGNVQYDKNMCPRSLELLGRAISVSVHQSTTSEDCQDAIEAIRKVAAHMAQAENGTSLQNQ